MKEPTPRMCTHCDFGMGHRGMDWCAKCGGTGSVFRVRDQVFPNTREGYDDAKLLLNENAEATRMQVSNI
jgi:DnaJ-class molecular chaperone